jgi:hypothetical protein
LRVAAGRIRERRIKHVCRGGGRAR